MGSGHGVVKLTLWKCLAVIQRLRMGQSITDIRIVRARGTISLKAEVFQKSTIHTV